MTHPDYYHHWPTLFDNSHFFIIKEFIFKNVNSYKIFLFKKLNSLFFTLSIQKITTLKKEKKKKRKKRCICFNAFTKVILKFL